MTNPELSPMDKLRVHMAALAAEAEAQGAAAVETAQANADEQRVLAAEGIARAAEVVRGLPRQTPEMLGPLYPGQDT